MHNSLVAFQADIEITDVMPLTIPVSNDLRLLSFIATLMESNLPNFDYVRNY